MVVEEKSSRGRLRSRVVEVTSPQSSETEEESEDEEKEKDEEWRPERKRESAKQQPDNEDEVVTLSSSSEAESSGSEWEGDEVPSRKRKRDSKPARGRGNVRRAPVGRQAVVGAKNVINVDSPSQLRRVLAKVGSSLGRGVIRGKPGPKRTAPPPLPTGVTFGCKVKDCARSFKDFQALQRHIVTMHRGSANIRGRGGARGGGGRVSIPASLSGTVITRKGDPMRKPVALPKFVSGTRWPGGTNAVIKPFKCPQCPFRVERQDLLNSHQKMVHSELRLTCPFCPEAFTKKALDEHMANHSKDCANCSESFETLTKLKEHRQAAHRETSFMCEQCGEVFDWRHKLDAHRRRKHELAGVPEKKLKCQECKKQYVDEFGLQRHVLAAHRTDKSEKTHICETCGKAFHDVRSLNCHKRSHNRKDKGDTPAGGKRHICSICGQSFSTKQHRHRHIFSHMTVKQFECKICGNGYARPPQCHEHLQKQHLIPKEHLENYIVKTKPFTYGPDGNTVIRTDPNEEAAGVLGADETAVPFAAGDVPPQFGFPDDNIPQPMQPDLVHRVA